MSQGQKFPIIECFGPTIQGEGALAGKRSHFIRFGGCDYRCSWCLAGNSKVLMADWTHKLLSGIQVGDSVMGLIEGDYNSSVGPTKVIDVHNNGIKPVVKVTSTWNELLCTADHKFRTDWWCEADKIGNNKVASLPQRVKGSEWELGWLAGVIDGDGSFSRSGNQGLRLDLDSVDKEIVLTAQGLLEARGFKVKYRTYTALRGSLVHKIHTNSSGEAEKIRLALNPPEDNVNFALGWLAGFYDAEGHAAISKTAYLVSQSRKVNPGKIDLFKKFSSLVGIDYTERDTGRDVSEFRIKDWAKFFSLCNPILARKKPSSIGRQAIPKVEVTVTSQDLLIPVYDLTTEAGSYIAEGFLVHNCDSLHAVEPDLVKANARWLLPSEIRNELEAIDNRGPSEWVTLTGGNPAMWELGEVVEYLQDLPVLGENPKGLSWKINVETQGSEWRDWLKRVEQVTCSPKGPSSGMQDKFEWGRLDKFVEELTDNHHSPSLVFKIVIFDELDLSFAEGIHTTYPGVDMYLSVGTEIHHENANDPDWLRMRVSDRYRWVSEQVLKKSIFQDVTIFPQLHVLAWPTEKTGR